MAKLRSSLAVFASFAAILARVGLGARDAETNIKIDMEAGILNERRTKMSAKSTYEETSQKWRPELLVNVNQTDQTNTTNHLDQPNVTVVEDHPPQTGFSSISNPNGTPWCDGAPTYWITGHDRALGSMNPDELGPLCFVNGTWNYSKTCFLDVADEMSRMHAFSGTIDRHSCERIDVNMDGLEDIVCGVGAGGGEGEGYNELYLTQENGTLRKIQRDHGLQKYPTMSNRFTAVLRDGQGQKKFVFFATIHGSRKDGRTNAHRMFENVYTTEDVLPYFTEVEGPWMREWESSCAVAGDFTHDLLDDLVVCRKGRRPLLVTQVWDDNNNKSSFQKVKLPKIKKRKQYFMDWHNLRIVDVTGDGINDLCVVTSGQPSKVYVFRGILGYPYFDFRDVYFEETMQWTSPDLECLDVNQDNVTDIYVVQVNMVDNDKYCTSEPDYTPNITASYVPPLDNARDVLFMGKSKNMSKIPFRPVVMHHRFPGCGFFAERWDDKTMLLSQGTWQRFGFNLLLNWE